jgi:hypothetical protein
MDAPAKLKRGPFVRRGIWLSIEVLLIIALSGKLPVMVSSLVQRFWWHLPNTLCYMGMGPRFQGKLAH